MKKTTLFTSVLIIISSFTFVKAQSYIPEICEVTVSPTYGKNVVTWNLPDTIQEGHINIYKNSGSVDTYTKIGESNYDVLEYIDYSSDPMNRNERYKISYTDELSNEYGLSDFHQTIILNVSNINSTTYLHWDEYLGREVRKYYVYRGTTSSNMQLLDSINSFVTFYNDLGISQIYYYSIDAQFVNECGEGEISLNAFYAPKNIVEEEIDFSLNIYPNPTNSIVNINFYNPDNTDFNIILTDIYGRKINEYSVNDNSKTIDLSNYKKGYYFVEINGFYSKRTKLIIN